MKNEEKSEEEFIEDIKKNIHNNVSKVSEKVINSAYSYLLKNGCVTSGKEELVKSFFVKKIPSVLSSEVSKELNSVLGLNLDL